MTVQEVTLCVEEGRSRNRVGSEVHGITMLCDLECYVERRGDNELEVTFETPDTPEQTRSVRQKFAGITGVEKVE